MSTDTPTHPDSGDRRLVVDTFADDDRFDPVGNGTDKTDLYQKLQANRYTAMLRVSDRDRETVEIIPPGNRDNDTDNLVVDVKCGFNTGYDGEWRDQSYAAAVGDAIGNHPYVTPYADVTTIARAEIPGDPVAEYVHALPDVMIDAADAAYRHHRAQSADALVEQLEAYVRVHEHGPDTTTDELGNILSTISEVESVASDLSDFVRKELER